MSDFITWAIDQHRNTNHLYADIIPYEFHLKMVVNEVEAALGNLRGLTSTEVLAVHRGSLIEAAWGHDLLEDCRVTYNDLYGAGCSGMAADIIYALTNEKGRNRKERANDRYYEGIRNTPGAGLIKFCDRIANVKFGKMMRSPQYEMYRKENPEFIEKVWVPELEEFGVKTVLQDLFEKKVLV